LKRAEIAILILAAGSSSRMDAIKQLLPWKNTVLINHAIRVAKAADASRVAVVLGARASKIMEVIDAETAGDVLMLHNKDWEQGMGTTIAYGMEQLLKSVTTLAGILIMLCDQPLIDTEYLNELISRFRTDKRGIVATRYGKGLGVPAIFGNAYFQDLKQLDSGPGARKLLAANKADCVIMDAGVRCTDIDTREDYLNLLSGI
jgi:molybdenum cofactor cytidylyltransferase